MLICWYLKQLICVKEHKIETFMVSLPKYATNPHPQRNTRKMSKQIMSVHDRFANGPLKVGSYRKGSPNGI